MYIMLALASDYIIVHLQEKRMYLMIQHVCYVAKWQLLRIYCFQKHGAGTNWSSG